MSAVPERQAQWLRGVLDLAVLATLDRDGTAYGYVLLQALDRAGIPDLKGGTLYPLLGRLEADALVTSEWRTGQSGPARKYFTITPAGRGVLAEGAAGWREFAARIAAILADDADQADPPGADTVTSAPGSHGGEDPT